MSATNLTTLAEHIDEHDLPWASIRRYSSRADVQLTNGSLDDLVRWASTLDDGSVVWEAEDFRDADPADPWWNVQVHGDLFGDVTVWCSLPADLGATAGNVEALMAGKQAALMAAAILSAD